MAVIIDEVVVETVAPAAAAPGTAAPPRPADTPAPAREVLAALARAQARARRLSAE